MTISMKKTLLIILKLSISTGLLILLAAKADITSLRNDLAALPLWGLLAGCCIMAIQPVVSGIRWEWLLHKLDPALPVNKAWCMRNCLTGSFFNQCLPSSIGGDALRVMAARKTGLDWSKATASVLAERGSGLFCFVFLASLGGAFSVLRAPAMNHVSMKLWLVCLFMLVGVASVIGTAFLIQLDLLPRPIKRLIAPIINLEFVARTIELLCRIFQSWRSALLICGLGMISSGLNVVVVCLYAWLMGQHTDPALLVMPVLLAILATLIPISIAGWGVREGTMTALLQLYGIPHQTGLALSLLFGLTVMLASLPGCISWLWPGQRTITA